MAEDLAQDTWIKIVEQSKGYRPLGSVKSWILKVARNICIDQLRIQNRWVELDEVAEAQLKDSAEEVDQALSNKEELFKLRNHIYELSVEHRTILMMALAEDLEYSEIAQQLKMSVANVKVTIFRIRQSLKEKMEGA